MANPTAEALLLALVDASAATPDTSASRGGGDEQQQQQQQLVGTIHVQSVPSQPQQGKVDGGGEVEIGLFSVDPDEQGNGIGGSLLSSAEEHAVATMHATCASMWVISVREDLLAWYDRAGYLVDPTAGTATFPDASANVGTVKLLQGEKQQLEFVRLKKMLV
jgi:ribosomal protein S18 acetylase RimI-like enzyme